MSVMLEGLLRTSCSLKGKKTVIAGVTQVYLKIQHEITNLPY